MRWRQLNSSASSARRMPIFRWSAIGGDAAYADDAALFAPRRTLHGRARARNHRAFGTWKSLGPGNIGGRTRGLVIHPTNPNIMWVGGASGGVWKTTDGGQLWTPQTDFAPVLTVNCLVIDPHDPDTLYAEPASRRRIGAARESSRPPMAAVLGADSCHRHPDFYFVNNWRSLTSNAAHTLGQTTAPPASGLASDGGVHPERHHQRMLRRGHAAGPIRRRRLRRLPSCLPSNPSPQFRRRR